MYIIYFLFTKDNAYLTAGTSSSSPKIGGSGPSGVILKGLIYTPLAQVPKFQYSKSNSSFLIHSPKFLPLFPTGLKRKHLIV